METAVQKTWKSTVAGILAIVAGCLSLIALLFLLIGLMIFMPVATGVLSSAYTGSTPILSSLLIFVIAIPGMAIAALALVGGIFAIKRKRWGWALTGSIAATIISTPLGIAAIIFTALSKNEFE